MNEFLKKFTSIDYGHLEVVIAGIIVKLIISIALFVIGSWIINKLVKLLANFLEKRSFDITIKRFIKNMIGATLKIFLVIFILNIVGVQTTSVLTLIGAAGLAIGLALQGTLTNFAGGVMLLLFKPFRVGDSIEAQGKQGTVVEIQLFTTVIKSPDNEKLVIIPNSTLSNGIIENHSTPKR